MVLDLFQCALNTSPALGAGTTNSLQIVKNGPLLLPFPQPVISKFMPSLIADWESPDLHSSLRSYRCFQLPTRSPKCSHSVGGILFSECVIVTLGIPVPWKAHEYALLLHRHSLVIQSVVCCHILLQYMSNNALPTYSFTRQVVVEV